MLVSAFRVPALTQHSKQIIENVKHLIVSLEKILMQPLVAG
jgi:hypothetical protein